MATTNLLPPFTAVRLAWALTGAFSDDPESKLAAVMAENTLKDIQDRAKSDNRENQYIVGAIATINSSQRSLDTVYKGRQLNFEENEKLREAYLEDVRDSLNFGKKAKDLFQSLPAMTIGAIGGVTVTQLLAQWITRATNIQINPDAVMWAFGLFFAAVGYLVNLEVVRRGRRTTQQLYVEQDYDRSIYYEQYVVRVEMILTSLYLDLDRIHKNVFKQSYPVGDMTVSQVVNDTLKGIKPTFCPYLHKHVNKSKGEKLVTPERWSTCESGLADAVEACPHWEGKTPARGTGAV